MDKITMNDINNILDSSISKVLNEELKDMEENKNEIEKFITGFKSDLAIDFLYKFYSSCVSYIPESVYNSHVYDPPNYPKPKINKNIFCTCNDKKKSWEKQNIIMIGQKLQITIKKSITNYWKIIIC